VQETIRYRQGTRSGGHRTARFLLLSAGGPGTRAPLAVIRIADSSGRVRSRAGPFGMTDLSFLGPDQCPAVQTFLVTGGRTVSYELALMTWKDWLTKM
jgi:hypothetical protein